MSFLERGKLRRLEGAWWSELSVETEAPCWVGWSAGLVSWTSEPGFVLSFCFFSMSNGGPADVQELLSSSVSWWIWAVFRALSEV